MNIRNNMNSMKPILTVFTGCAMLLVSGMASATFVPFVIRDAATFSVGATETTFVTDVGGEKAGFGSNDINGNTLGNIVQLKIERTDDTSRFTPGSGPAVAPYLNFWITDGTNFAVVANEPSNGAFQPLYNDGYDLTFADLSNKVAKIYENADTSWLPNGGLGLTFADLAGFTIQAPTVSELTTGWLGLGTGAPRELGTNVAYGVNWVFGDTLANYQSDGIGYVVGNNASVSAAAAIPLPSTAWLFGPALIGLLGVTRRKRK